MDYTMLCLHFQPYRHFSLMGIATVSHIMATNLSLRRQGKVRCLAKDLYELMLCYTHSFGG